MSYNIDIKFIRLLARTFIKVISIILYIFKDLIHDVLCRWLRCHAWYVHSRTHATCAKEISAGRAIRTIRSCGMPIRNGAKIAGKRNRERKEEEKSERYHQQWWSPLKLGNEALSFSLLKLCQSRHIVSKCCSCSCYLSSGAESEHGPGDPSLAPVCARDPSFFSFFFCEIDPRIAYSYLIFCSP